MQNLKIYPTDSKNTKYSFNYFWLNLSTDCLSNMIKFDSYEGPRGWIKGIRDLQILFDISIIVFLSSIEFFKKDKLTREENYGLYGYVFYLFFTSIISAGIRFTYNRESISYKTAATVPIIPIISILLTIFNLEFPGKPDAITIATVVGSLINSKQIKQHMKSFPKIEGSEENNHNIDIIMKKLKILRIHIKHHYHFIFILRAFLLPILLACLDDFKKRDHYISVVYLCFATMIIATPLHALYLYKSKSEWTTENFNKNLGLKMCIEDFEENTKNNQSMGNSEVNIKNSQSMSISTSYSTFLLLQAPVLTGLIMIAAAPESKKNMYLASAQILIISGFFISKALIKSLKNQLPKGSKNRFFQEAENSEIKNPLQIMLI